MTNKQRAVLRTLTENFPFYMSSSATNSCGLVIMASIAIGRVPAMELSSTLAPPGRDHML